MDNTIVSGTIEHANLALIPFLPLLGAVLAYLVGRKNKDIGCWIATTASILAGIWTFILVGSLPHGGFFEQRLFTWFSFDQLTVEFALRFDQLSAIMCMVVTGVGSLIHLYSVAYMHEDESRHRFFAYLNLFMFSMLLLVLGANLLILFIGWEGVGLCSYLLIGFWYKNINFAGAGRKAFVVNRIGDAGVLIAMFLLVMGTGSLDFNVIQGSIGNLNNIAWCAGCLPVITVIALCLFVGATGKSAQIPLFVWLPDAMAGPTPVSALIHAATMVTAGVYMMTRCHFIFDQSPEALVLVSFIAVATAFVAATTALTQYDIKKVLAYSTVSQLGFMFMAAGAGVYWVAIFHVVTHAFFKACLFLGAGSVIHGCHHEQDMRQMGGLARKMPITFATYAASVLAIAGIYPLSGYYSKHAILAAVEASSNVKLIPYVETIGILATLTAFITAFYMTRSLVMTFFGKYRGHAHPHESPPLMTIPLVVLATLACLSGIVGGKSLSSFLAMAIPDKGIHFHSEGVLTGLAHSWVGIAGVALAFLLYTKLATWPGIIFRNFAPISRLFSNKYYFDEIYGALIVGPLQSFANTLWRVVDQGLIDGIVNGSARVVDVSGELVRSTQTGQIRTYALFMFVGAILIITFYLVMR